MDYLVLLGGDLKGVLSEALGNAAPYFWSTVAPIGLAIVWLGSVHALLSTWFRSRDPKDDAQDHRSVIPRMLLSLLLVVMIISSGSGLAFLPLGKGFLHSRTLADILAVVRPG